MTRLSLALMLALAATTAAAQDPVKVSPKNYSIEVENQWVRALRVKQGPHEKMPMHEHPASVAIYLTDVHEKITSADGKAREVTRKAGDVAWLEAARQTEENLSDQPLETVVVELKPGAPKLKPAPITLDPVKLDPEHHLVPLENDRVRVLRTILEPHLKSPMHEHPSYVVVYLTVLHTTMTLGDGRVVDNPRRPGEVAWRDPLKHVTENIGDRTAVEIQVELK
jgi:quercetin dioxygenase-like cupin family protein